MLIPQFQIMIRYGLKNSNYYYYILGYITNQHPEV